MQTFEVIIDTMIIYLYLTIILIHVLFTQLILTVRLRVRPVLQITEVIKLASLRIGYETTDINKKLNYKITSEIHSGQKLRCGSSKFLDKRCNIPTPSTKRNLDSPDNFSKGSKVKIQRPKQLSMRPPSKSSYHAFSQKHLGHSKSQAYDIEVTYHKFGQPSDLMFLQHVLDPSGTSSTNAPYVGGTPPSESPKDLARCDSLANCVDHTWPAPVS